MPFPATPSVLQAALHAYDNGVCVLPATTNGNKLPRPYIITTELLAAIGLSVETLAPLVRFGEADQTYWKSREAKAESMLKAWQDGKKHWGPFLYARAPKAMLEEWFSSRRETGISIICGKVSMNLEGEDFDNPTIYERYEARAKERGLGDLLDRVAGGFLSRTPSGGHHLLYPCKVIEGNQKLAERQDPNDLKKTLVLIETRGEGGQFIEAPSYGRVHPSGRPYVQLRGGLATIENVSPEERRLLLDLARSFDEIPNRPALQKPNTRSGERKPLDPTKPGDDYSTKVSWSEILSPHGYRLSRTEGSEEHWTRPGKDSGTSLTTNYQGNDRLTAFSSNAQPFEPWRADRPKTYSKFEAFTLLNHHGNFKAAAGALRKLGYGQIVIEPNQPHDETPPWMSDFVTPEQTFFDEWDTSLNVTKMDLVSDFSLLDLAPTGLTHPNIRAERRFIYEMHEFTGIIQSMTGVETGKFVTVDITPDEAVGYERVRLWSMVAPTIGKYAEELFVTPRVDCLVRAVAFITRDHFDIVFVPQFYTDTWRAEGNANIQKATRWLRIVGCLYLEGVYKLDTRQPRLYSFETRAERLTLQAVNRIRQALERHGLPNFARFDHTATKRVWQWITEADPSKVFKPDNLDVENIQECLDPGKTISDMLKGLDVAAWIAANPDPKIKPVSNLVSTSTPWSLQKRKKKKGAAVALAADAERLGVKPHLSVVMKAVAEKYSQDIGQPFLVSSSPPRNRLREGGNFFQLSVPESRLGAPPKELLNDFVTILEDAGLRRIPGGVDRALGLEVSFSRKRK